MTATDSRLLIIGGNSAIARRLLALVPSARAIARAGNDPRVRTVGCYTRLGPHDFEGVDTVVNCAGIVTGDAATLHAVNVSLQNQLATAARAAGARRFVAISSFSIFGNRQAIDETTPPCPEDHYGEAKLAAEHGLERLQTTDFATVSVALPAIVGTTRVGKVERMLHWWQQIGTWPMPVGDVTRSMIGAEGAARVLAAVAVRDWTGRVLAADPVAFRYRRVARWLREDARGRFGLLPLRPALLAPVRHAAPRLHRSLMTDSHLADESNHAIIAGVETTLRPTLSAMLAERQTK